MTDLSGFLYTDFLDDVLAVIANRLIAGNLRGELTNTETISGTKTLTDGDCPIQNLTPSGANQKVLLAPEAVGNHHVFIRNASATYNLVIKDDSDTTTFATILPLTTGWLIPIGGTTWAADDRGKAAANGLASLNASSKVVQDPANATATPTASKIPIADANGLLDSWVSGSNGYIAENSAQLLYVGAAAYSVLPGEAIVNGTKLSWVANIARTGLSLSANTLYYVYLYSNSGTPAVEESTTAPIWDTTLMYYKKTGDATRRCIGYLSVNATPAIRSFLNVVTGRVSEIVFVDGDETGRQPVSSGASPSAWTSFTLAPLVPAHATHVSLLAKCILVTSGDDGIVALSPTDLGAAVANTSITYYRGRAGAANANVFFGSSFFPIATASTYYYRTLVVSGACVANILVEGCRFVR
jgi:hypothetical protein